MIDVVVSLRRFQRKAKIRTSKLLKKAKVAQLVEHDLAKVGVASSNLVFRSKSLRKWRLFLFFSTVTKVDSLTLHTRPGGGTGRHAGLMRFAFRSK